MSGPKPFREQGVAKRRFGDFSIDCVSRADLVAWCEHDITEGQRPPRVVMDANGHGLSLARSDATYRAMIGQADILHADGGFLVTLSRLRSGPAIPERSATTDMIHDFAARFAATGHSFFLLGGDEATNAAAARRLVDAYPGLRIAGRHHGFFSDAEETQIAEAIDRSGADVVWVGLGKPREQAVALRLRACVSASWIITCGGCFNYITGSYARAPHWMQKANLEWLHRMVTNPRKLFWRYAVTTPHALWIALTRR